MAAPTPDDDLTVDGPAGSQIRYVPLHHVYSSTSPASSGSLAVMSKKPKARKLILPPSDDSEEEEPLERPPLVQFYSRRPKRFRPTSNYFDSNGQLDEVEEEEEEEESEAKIVEKKKKRKRRRVGSGEDVDLGVDSSALGGFEGPKSRDCRKNHSGGNGRGSRRKKRSSAEKVVSGTDTTKRWHRLSFQGADPKSFIGLECKVYWPLDADWYSGIVIGYNQQSNRHRVEYKDGDKEDLILSNQKIKFFISGEEMQHLDLRLLSGEGSDDGTQKLEEVAVLAASLDDCQEFEPGDIIWAKPSGRPMWPAIVVDESLIGDNKGLKKTSGGRSVPIQFFGIHDFARIRTKQIVPFLKGLISFQHLNRKKPLFVRSLEEAKMYLSEQKLPRKMLWLQNGFHADDSASISGEDKENTDSDEDFVKDVGIENTLEGLTKSPYIIGDLQIISVGKIVKDSEHFRDEKFIWPVGYTAVRKFTSITDQNACSLYKMEVLRDAESKIRPLFRVTLESGEQFKGQTPSSCWNKIYKRIKKIESGASSNDQGELETTYRSGTDMFGFSNPEVLKLVQGLSKSRLPSKFPMCKSASQKYRDLPVGYRPVRIDWKHLDKCNVCHMDEEYENNLFLQCDKCRMMVHARCYGELEPMGGVLWQCNLCRSGAPESPPPCCLCPVIGGAMKPTADGRWAHLACAIWIPETCLSDVKTMEPIDGLSRINKDRWKLLCSVCGVSYGACIQCTNNSCRVAYHPLCARAAGFCVELENEDRLHLLSRDAYEENQSIRLLSFCKKHRQTSNEPSATDDRIGHVARRCSDYNPPSNPSGCARSEPYNFFGRRGRKEPEALAAASLKRLFVENRPYLVSGHSQHDVLGSTLPSKGAVSSQFSLRLQRIRSAQLDAPNNIISMAEKYKYMRETFRKRLAFGKSGIHGFGIFAKHPHRAGDMMIEYTGELVRPPIADRREHLIYNSLVGAGTYMFRIDDERVIDATRAGSIAHLINHSCEPNCYSRVISVNGDEHIIIFAKRDIYRWEELTYDYRFFSIDEQLACSCGFPRCRGIVNDVEAEQVSELHAPRSELIDWDEE